MQQSCQEPIILLVWPWAEAKIKSSFHSHTATHRGYSEELLFYRIGASHLFLKANVDHLQKEPAPGRIKYGTPAPAVKPTLTKSDQQDWNHLHTFRGLIVTAEWQLLRPCRDATCNGSAACLSSAITLIDALMGLVEGRAGGGHREGSCCTITTLSPFHTWVELAICCRFPTSFFSSHRSNGLLNASYGGVTPGRCFWLVPQREHKFYCCVLLVRGLLSFWTTTDLEFAVKQLEKEKQFATVTTRMQIYCTSDVYEESVSRVFEMSNFSAGQEDSFFYFHSIHHNKPTIQVVHFSKMSHQSHKWKQKQQQQQKYRLSVVSLLSAAVRCFIRVLSTDLLRCQLLWSCCLQHKKTTFPRIQKLWRPRGQVFPLFLAKVANLLTKASKWWREVRRTY